MTNTEKSFFSGDLWVFYTMSCTEIVLSQDFFVPTKFFLSSTMVVTFGLAFEEMSPVLIF